MFVPGFCFGSREAGFPLHGTQLDISSPLHRWELATDISWHSGAASPGSRVRFIFGAKSQHSFPVSSPTSRAALACLE